MIKQHIQKAIDELELIKITLTNNRVYRSKIIEAGFKLYTFESVNEVLISKLKLLKEMI